MNMPVSINGIEQLPEEGREALLKLQSHSRFGVWGFWVAVASFIVAIIAVTRTI
jgi:hypothetical protein